MKNTLPSDGKWSYALHTTSLPVDRKEMQMLDLAKEIYRNQNTREGYIAFVCSSTKKVKEKTNPKISRKSLRSLLLIFE